jgi:hypothetical protein
VIVAAHCDNYGSSLSSMQVAMCLNCFSTGEVIAANAVLASGLGSQLTIRMRLLRKSPEQRRQRRQAVWDKNAAFLSDLGHDPIALLGPRPGDLPPKGS